MQILDDESYISTEKPGMSDAAEVMQTRCLKDQDVLWWVLNVQAKELVFKRRVHSQLCASLGVLPGKPSN